MFGGLSISLILKLLGMVSIGGAIYYAMHVLDEKERLEEQVLRHEANIASLNASLSKKDEEISFIKQTFGKIEKLNNELKSDNEDLRKKFNKISNDGSVRDLGVLGKAKPKLVGKIINKGTQEAMRCMELAMGDVVDEKDTKLDCYGSISSVNGLQ